MRKKGILWELAAIGGVIARLNLVNQEERADETRLHQAMSHFTLISAGLSSESICCTIL